MKKRRIIPKRHSKLHKDRKYHRGRFDREKNEMSRISRIIAIEIENGGINICPNEFDKFIKEFNC